MSEERENHQLINQDSGDVEYYTDPKIVEAARRVLGGVIELDPFSSYIANQRVCAERIFTINEDGFKQDWLCETLWMNHPFGRDYNKRAIDKLVSSYVKGHIRRAACCITYAATSEKWFQPLTVYPQCYLSPRTNYYLPDGSLKKGVTKGSVVTYLGGDVEKFAREFSPFGSVKVLFSGYSS